MQDVQKLMLIQIETLPPERQVEVTREIFVRKRAFSDHIKLKNQVTKPVR